MVCVGCTTRRTERPQAHGSSPLGANGETEARGRASPMQPPAVGLSRKGTCRGRHLLLDQAAGGRGRQAG